MIHDLKFNEITWLIEVEVTNENILSTIEITKE